MCGCVHSLRVCALFRMCSHAWWCCVLGPWQLSPTFGGPVNNMVRIARNSSDSKDDDGRSGPLDCIAYSTADRVVGLSLLPITGNPKHSMGLVAHPRKVRLRVFCCCHNRFPVFTATSFQRSW